MTGAVEIVFPKNEETSTLIVPTEPMAPASNALASVVSKDRMELRCTRLLGTSTLARASEEASTVYRKMLDNSQVVMTYGSNSLDGVNALVDRLLHEMEPVKIPELTELMRNLNKGMREIRNNYDVSDQKVRERLDNWNKKVLGIFKKGKTFIEMLMEDVTSIEKQLDKVKNDLTGRQQSLMENVSYYDALYEENEQAIGQLIYVIAVMELIRDLAANEAAVVQVGNTDLGDRNAEKKAQLAEFASNMEMKISEYKGRLWVAWATAPQIRMMRSMNISLAGRINEMVCLTIPTMRQTIVVWRSIAQAKEAAEVTAEVRGASNDWLQSMARSAAQAIPMIAEEVNTPTLAPETVFAMASSIAAQAEGIVRAMENGVERRKALDQAMVEAHSVLNDSATKVSDALINRIVDQAQQVEIVTSIANN